MLKIVLNGVLSLVLIEENKEFLEEETKTFAPNSKHILATLKRNIGKGLFLTLIILSKQEMSKSLSLMLTVKVFTP